MNVLIRCEGGGSRLWPLTETRSKAVIPVVGVSCLERHLRNIAALANCPKVWVGANPRDTAATETLVRKYKLAASVEAFGQPTYADIRALISRHPNEPLLCIAGDNCSEIPIAELVAVSSETGRSTVAVFRDEHSSLMSVAFDERNTIVSFRETSHRDVGTAMFVLQPRDFSAVHSILDRMLGRATGLIQELAGCVALSAHSSIEPWFDIGSQKGFLAASRYYAQLSTSWGRDELGNIYPERWSGARSHVVGCVLLGPALLDDCMLTNCVIDAGSTLRGLKARDGILSSRGGEGFVEAE